MTTILIIRTYFQFLLVFSFIVMFKTSNESNANRRIIKLSDFLEQASYLPVKNGEEFIIEVEGNPSTGYKWYLDNAEIVAKNKVLFPFNLDSQASGLFYNSHKDSSINNGIYHFHFSAKKPGNEKLVFAYYKQPKERVDKIIEIHVKDIKKDL